MVLVTFKNKKPFLGPNLFKVLVSFIMLMAARGCYGFIRGEFDYISVLLILLFTSLTIIMKKISTLSINTRSHFFFLNLNTLTF